LTMVKFAASLTAAAVLAGSASAFAPARASSKVRHEI
jgi:hypothetical protein